MLQHRLQRCHYRRTWRQSNIDEQNAQGDSNTCSTIITDFVSDNVDLILANATPALQAAAAGTADIPILGTSVTEYGVALDLDDFDGTVGNNISGTSDLAPLEDQAAMLNELFPDAKNVGLVYLLRRSKLPVSGGYSKSSS